MTGQGQGRATYEPPALMPLGSVHDLTQTGKQWGPADGLLWIVPITNTSP